MMVEEHFICQNAPTLWSSNDKSTYVLCVNSNQTWLSSMKREPILKIWICTSPVWLLHRLILSMIVAVLSVRKYCFMLYIGILSLANITRTNLLVSSVQSFELNVLAVRVVLLSAQHQCEQSSPSPSLPLPLSLLSPLLSHLSSLSLSLSLSLPLSLSLSLPLSLLCEASVLRSLWLSEMRVRWTQQTWGPSSSPLVSRSNPAQQNKWRHINEVLQAVMDSVIVCIRLQFLLFFSSTAGACCYGSPVGFKAIKILGLLSELLITSLVLSS